VSTTIPVVKAALVQRLKVALPDTQVIYGSSGSVTTRGDRVVVVGKTIGRRDPDSMDSQTYSEDYTVEIVISVSISAYDMRTAEELALGDYAAADASIRSSSSQNLGLGSNGVQRAMPDGSFECFEQADNDGRHAAVRFFIHVLAQPSSAPSI